MNVTFHDRALLGTLHVGQVVLQQIRTLTDEVERHHDGAHCEVYYEETRARRADLPLTWIHTFRVTIYKGGQLVCGWLLTSQQMGADPRAPLISFMSAPQPGDDYYMA